MPARQDEQEFFGLGEDGLLVYVERVRTADGLPIFLENQFFPYQEFRGLMEEDLNDVSLFEVIERVSGRRPVDSFRRTLEITRASVEQAQKLGIPLSEPLMHLNSYFVDEEGKPLCIGRQYYIGSRYMFDL